ncbi:MAG: acylphosphatase [Bdellovibrionales bacterium]|nr:acylphosphatase [Bdellovibrionales bacterium]
MSGRVQGVGFRFHTQQKASALGVLGWVRNLEDGRVEVEAHAEANIMQELVDWLKVGPANAKVENIVVQDANWDEPARAFEIRR